MKRRGKPRRQLLVELVPDVAAGSVVVDVGADHGHVAHALGAIATERAPGIPAAHPELPWVLADGLAPFRHVDVAVIAGMGARTIAGILQRGPRPRQAVVVHAQDDPPQLRQWLAAHGWRIDREGLAPEAGRFAEVIRAVPGREPSAGEELALGPWLLAHRPAYTREHLEQLLGHWRAIAQATRGRAPERHAQVMRRVTHIEGALAPADEHDR